MTSRLVNEVGARLLHWSWRRSPIDVVGLGRSGTAALLGARRRLRHGVGLRPVRSVWLRAPCAGYRDILRHYYSQTRIGSVGASVVRVLLQANESTIHFSGATIAVAES